MDPFNPGSGDQELDPLFVDPINNNFHLQDNSPCIGSGRYGDDRGALPFIPTAIDEPMGMPEAFELLPSYPNPFNASTTIHYLLPSASEVSIDVYDILGNHLETLCDDYQTAGYKQVTWRADKYSSGVYFFRIQAGDFSKGEKITLLK